MKTKTYNANGICFEMTTYTTLRASILENKLRKALIAAYPDILKTEDDERTVYLNFVSLVPDVINIGLVEPNEDNRILMEWWEKYRNFDKDASLIPDMWTEYLELPDQCSNNLFCEAHKNTRRDTLPPSEEFAVGATEKAKADPNSSAAGKNE